ncbi:MAG: hypothetical protein O7F73_11705, partial [Gammaproteobacteria bacterium]|nr:hypothetical protein [Gammaproteobacteria bacterium]
GLLTCRYRLDCRNLVKSLDGLPQGVNRQVEAAMRRPDGLPVKSCLRGPLFPPFSINFNEL